MTEQGRQIAVVRDYDGLHAALRARAAELVAEIGRAAFDAIPDCGCEGWQPLKAPVITSEAAE